MMTLPIHFTLAAVLSASPFALSPVPPAAAPAAATARPTLENVSSRTVELTQTVTLKDIPTGAKQVRLWVPIPSDAPHQRVLDRTVVDAPRGWRLVPQSDGRGDMLYVELANPTSPTAAVTVKATVERLGVAAPLQGMASDSLASPPINASLFTDELNTRAPLMTADERAKALAEKAVGDETDPARVAYLLLQAVADAADHYSKDPSKPTCGRGAADDCLDHGGGCCTDLHSLFIAMAREKGIPARIEYGYRLMPQRADSAAPYDPGYRCWVEYFVPGAGWIPTDIVAADAAPADHPNRFGSLSDTKLWLWSGRSFELTPAAKAGRIDTMISGWAEIDGVAVDPLPAKDGSPSKLGRTVQFHVVSETPPKGPRLPE
ncbi:MAG: transglutaminase domain-containing protein [Phycisphaerae bacterium]|nr:transglutaminase domain-containing protein [Phycisphaerae bacterium]